MKTKMKEYIKGVIYDFQSMTKKDILGMVLFTVVILSTRTVSAGSADTTKIDTVVTTIIVPWVEKIGLVIAFVGAIMFAAGWRNDDADSKSRGLQTLVSGFMMAGVAKAYDTIAK